MKKKFLFLILLLATVCIMTAQAITTRASTIVPSLSFNSTTATCVVVIRADTDDADIIVNAELLEDGDPYRNWTGSGTGRLQFKRTASVRKGHTYTFSADVTIDGKTYSTRPITGSF